jgi:hypothetical protein
VIEVAAVTEMLLAAPGPGVRTVRASSLAAAVETGAQLVWLLEPGAVHARGALERLVDALGPPGEAPLATGLALESSGRPADALTPRGKQLDVEELAAGGLRRLPVRYAHLANTLVRRDAIERAGLPQASFGPYAAQEWTTRLLAGRRAWLEPASTVRLPAGWAPRQPGWRDAAATMRMLRTGAWSRGEALRALAALGG